jgi:hypothetical protein
MSRTRGSKCCDKDELRRKPWSFVYDAEPEGSILVFRNMADSRPRVPTGALSCMVVRGNVRAQLGVYYARECRVVGVGPGWSLRGARLLVATRKRGGGEGAQVLQYDPRSDRQYCLTVIMSETTSALCGGEWVPDSEACG